MVTLTATAVTMTVMLALVEMVCLISVYSLKSVCTRQYVWSTTLYIALSSSLSSSWWNYMQLQELDDDINFEGFLLVHTDSTYLYEPIESPTKLSL